MFVYIIFYIYYQIRENEETIYYITHFLAILLLRYTRPTTTKTFLHALHLIPHKYSLNFINLSLDAY